MVLKFYDAVVATPELDRAICLWRVFYSLVVVAGSISNLHFLFFFFNQAFPDFVKITLEDTIEGFVSSQMTFNDAKEQIEEILWKLEEEIDDNNN